MAAPRAVAATPRGVWVATAGGSLERVPWGEVTADRTIPSAFAPDDHFQGLAAHGELLIVVLRHGIVVRSAESGAELSRLGDSIRYTTVSLVPSGADLLARLDDPPTSQWARIDPRTGALSPARPPTSDAPTFREGVFRDRSGREHSPLGIKEGAEVSRAIVGDRGLVWATARPRESPNANIDQALELHILPGKAMLRVPGTHVRGVFDAGATTVGQRFWLSTLTLGGPTVVTLYRLSGDDLEPLRTFVTTGSCNELPSAGPHGAAIVDCDDRGGRFVRAVASP